ncbi:cytoplasmic dynein 2 heavy chain 1 [Trichonephila clavipes]|nr:cytoplasmic dynein 2 heavy chain 1 [Trichonephila clavipes]
MLLLAEGKLNWNHLPNGFYNDFVLETSVTGTILNGLSHLKNSKNISQFAINLSRGLGSNLRKQSREALIREIFSWANLIIPDLNSPCDTYYNERTQRLEVYQMQEDEISASEYENNSLDVIQTEDCMRTIDYLSPWLLNEKMPPFLLVGPDGCGKSTLLRNCLQQEQTISSTMVHCNAQTKPHHVLQKLMSVCTIIGAQSGRVLRPKESDHLILYLRDLSLPKPDKWGTSQLLAWLQQILTYNGFYDENAEWISLEGIQIVGSVSSISLAGRHSLTTRFTSRMYIYAVELSQRFQRTGDVTRQPVPGRQRVTTLRQDRYLVISARRQRSSTARALGSALTVATGIRISRQTVYRRLNHASLYARRPAVCIPLTSAHKRALLNWSLKHQHWSVGEWVNVMFSDESRFSLSCDSRRITIWRERGTRFEPRNIMERHHFPSRGEMVWASIMMDSRTDLHFFDTKSVTAQRYRYEVLEPYVRLFRGAVDPDFIFLDDNAPCHRVVLIDDFLQTENIQRMSWPVNSPDLNPIKNVWEMLGRQIAALSHPPSSITELKRALPQLIHHLIASMVNRCAACLAVRGDHTPY